MSDRGIVMLQKFLRDNRGQFAIMFAVVISLLFGAMMIGIDSVKLSSAKTKVAAITDSAALAGAQAYDEKQRKKIVRQFLMANTKEMLPAETVGKPSVDFDDENSEVTVSIRTSVPLTFGRFLGLGSKEVSYQSVAAYPNSFDPLTIAFVLDVSGSMGWKTKDGEVKLDSLKDATSQMFRVIEHKVNDIQAIEKNVRTSLSAFNGTLKTEHAMSWGFEDIEDAIQKLDDGGWTNSFVALDDAYKKIMADRRFRLSKDPTLNLKTLDEFVIFMTDGENTAGDSFKLDEDSYETCISMRQEGIEVFTIAFTAPDQGKLLLMDCASWDKKSDDLNSNRQEMRKQRCREKAKNENGNFEGLMKQCEKDILELKKNHYFDAEDAKSFREIFEIIGQKINEAAIRIKS